MTIASRMWPRNGILDGVPAERRLFRVAPNASLLGHCHWQPDPSGAPTLLLVHGLEGSSESHYMRGIAAKAWRRGFNVVRLNQRNCGGTEHLADTLYHSGLSQDLRAVVQTLTAVDGVTRLWMVGYSMGGNLVLGAAGRYGAELAALQGVVAVAPSIDPAACIEALERRENWIYQVHFLRRLSQRLERKARHFPGKWDLAPLRRIRTLRAFDDRYTAPDGGFRDASDYYERVGARHVLPALRVPALIVASQDDPFIPYRIFERPEVAANPLITVWAPRFGGHCAFMQRPSGPEDLYWAENRIIEVLAARTALAGDRAPVPGWTS